MKRIKDDIGFFKKRFSKTAAKDDFGKEWNSYRIHDMKFQGTVLSELLSNQLAWQTKRGDSSWWSFHPTLGRAIMSAIAVSIANAKGLDIVTDDHVAHRSVCTQRTQDVYEELLGTVTPPPPQPAAGAEDELAHLVMTTCFNVEKLTIPQIVELQKDGSDLKKFKQKLTSIAGQIPDVSDPEERQRRLETAAREVLSEWEKQQSSLIRKGFGAILDATDTKLPEGAVALFGVATGATLLSVMALATGAAIGLTGYGGLKMWRKYKEGVASPYNYLNRITKAGAVLAVPTSIRKPKPGFLGKLKKALGRK